MRNWVVGGALIPRVGGVDLNGLVLVGNRRRDRADGVDTARRCDRPRRVDPRRIGPRGLRGDRADRRRVGGPVVLGRRRGPATRLAVFVSRRGRQPTSSATSWWPTPMASSRTCVQVDGVEAMTLLATSPQWVHVPVVDWLQRCGASDRDVPLQGDRRRPKHLAGRAHRMTRPAGHPPCRHGRVLRQRRASSPTGARRQAGRRRRHRPSRRDRRGVVRGSSIRCALGVAERDSEAVVPAGSVPAR